MNILVKFMVITIIGSQTMAKGTSASESTSLEVRREVPMRVPSTVVRQIIWVTVGNTIAIGATVTVMSGTVVVSTSISEREPAGVVVHPTFVWIFDKVLKNLLFLVHSPLSVGTTKQLVKLLDVV